MTYLDSCYSDLRRTKNDVRKIVANANAFVDASDVTPGINDNRTAAKFLRSINSRRLKIREIVKNIDETKKGIILLTTTMHPNLMARRGF